MDLLAHPSNLWSPRPDPQSPGVQSWSGRERNGSIVLYVGCPFCADILEIGPIWDDNGLRRSWDVGEDAFLSYREGEYLLQCVEGGCGHLESRTFRLRGMKRLESAGGFETFLESRRREAVYDIINNRALEDQVSFQRALVSFTDGVPMTPNQMARWLNGEIERLRLEWMPEIGERVRDDRRDARSGRDLIQESHLPQ
jgi:hypothetical protein